MNHPSPDTDCPVLTTAGMNPACSTEGISRERNPKQQMSSLPERFRVHSATILVAVLLSMIPLTSLGQVIDDARTDPQDRETTSRVFLPLAPLPSVENRPPVAVDIAYTLLEDTTLVVGAATGVLANDSDPDGDAIQAELVEDVTHGTLVLGRDGVLVYTPTPDFHGEDTFTYRAQDATTASAPATVTLTVQPVNDAPVAHDDAYATDKGTPLTVSAAQGVLANDSDPEGDALLAALVDDADHGTVSLQTDGAFVYTPAPDFQGADRFQYQAFDATTASATTTVTVTVRAGNDAPIAQDDTYATAENTPLTVDATQSVLANDVDPNGDALTAVVVSDVISGVLAFAADGTFTYTPTTGFSGRDQFQYVATDGTAQSSPVVVTIDVNAHNRGPQLASGATGFEKQVLDDTVRQAHFAVAGDLDSDGDMDIAATDYVNGIVPWYENDGAGNFTRHVLDDALEGAYPASVGDVDGDGDTDLLVAGYLADTFVWYRNDGNGAPVRQDIDTTADGAHSIITADVDLDGDADLVTASQDAGIVAWYENDGAQNFTARIVDTGALGAKRADAADIDGDGDVDLMAASFDGKEVAWYDNDGTQNFTKKVINSKANGAYYVSHADVDGDGDVDLFSANRRNHEIAFYRNDGAGNFTVDIVDSRAWGARTVVTADVDGDGFVDALSTAADADRVTWYRNDGTGNFTEEVLDDNADGAYGVFATDIDLDGDVDILSASRDSFQVALYTQTNLQNATVEFNGTLLIDGALLRTVDPDDGPEGLTYTLTDVPAYGEIRRDGAALTPGGIFTQADVDAQRVTYVHSAAHSSTDRFAFVVADGGEDGATSVDGVVKIAVTRPVEAESLLLHLPLDEGTGTVAVDASGNGHDGTLVNGAAFAAGTGDGSAFAVQFDGMDDRIDVGTLDVTGSGLTLANWFNAASFPGSPDDPRFISQASGTAADDHVFMLGTIGAAGAARLRARVKTDGTTATLIATDGNLPTGVWHHAAMTYDGATLRIYLDGTEVGSMPLSGPVTADPAVPVAVGAQPQNAGNNAFDGLIDDVRIYTRALSNAEIAELASAGP